MSRPLVINRHYFWLKFRTVIATAKPERQLLTIAAGSWGEVARFSDEAIGSKLLSMGVLPGSRISLIRKASFGGTYYVKVDNLRLALRREEAASIVLR